MSKPINALLVDDEPRCLKNLQHYITQVCPRIEVCATATDFDSAAALMSSGKAQLAFLDVQLFDRTAFDLFRPGGGAGIPVIFVSAYEQYAVSAFRVSAIDYIVKPLQREDMQRCYAKIERHFDSPPPAPTGRIAKIMLRQGEHVYLVSPDNIILLQAQGFYTSVCFEHEGRQREITLSKPINVVHDEWSNPQLLRVHRSFVVNVQRIRSVRKTAGSLQLSVGGYQIPVAKRRSADFLQRYGE